MIVKLLIHGEGGRLIGGKIVAKKKKTSKKPNAAHRVKAAGGSVSTMDRPRGWTFLTNHSHVLILLHRNPDMVLREVAQQVGITERAVQRIVQDLEEGGFVVRERVGRQNHYEVMVDQSLRHPIESHRDIGDLLDLVAEQ